MDTGNPNVWRAALSLATKAHTHQWRKDGVTPYISHPVRVCLALSQIFEVKDPDILAAALLHDVIEDTDTDYDDVTDACGKDVADLVAALSKDTRVEHDRREELYREQLASASWKARIIKIADLHENLIEASVSRIGINVWTPAEHAIKDATGVLELEHAADILTGLMNSLESEKPYLDGTKKKEASRGLV